MQSGSPSAVYCNCPVERTHRPCNSVNQKLAKASIVPTPSSFSSEYIDAHSIRIQIPPHAHAFAYIFEYATVSTRSDEWYFAGASTTPMVTFTILDPCRDYKFRVIVVTRSTDPVDHFVIYHEKSIPVQLPPFILSSDQIYAESPIFNSTTDLLKIYVRWTLPRGYTDSDIYGYEAPALYPLQCHTPEDELPQPKIEIVRAGGRLAVTLPSSVLEARCRLWVEVRMLPRCVRLEPFSVQKNIEIDCERNPELDICSKEANPICMEIQEISGTRGRATLTWLPPTQTPLYYHVRYGPAQMKGNPPFVTWQLATKRDVKVESSVTSLTLDVVEDQDFGVQVCAILTPHRKRPKFGLIRVTPFHCTSCNNTPTHAVGRCGECGRVEGTTVDDNGWKDAVKARDPIQTHKVKSVSSQTVYRMETDLFVGVAGHGRHSATNISVAQVNTHAAEAPIAIERAEEINELATTSSSSQPVSTVEVTAEDTVSATDTSTTPAMTPAETTTPADVEFLSTTASEAASTATMTATTTTTESTATLEDTIPTTDASPPEDFTSPTTELPSTDEHDGVVDVMVDLMHNGSETGSASTASQAGEKLNTVAPVEQKEDVAGIDETHLLDDDQKRERLSKELEESVKHLEKALEDAEHARQSSPADVDFELLPLGNQTVSEEALKKAASELVNKLESSSAEVRHHEKSKKCLLSTGIVCNFGCETSKTCRCPPETHVLSSDGGCVSRESFGNIVCLPSSDINATWDPLEMNVMIRNLDVSAHIRSAAGADHLFVEFGRITDVEPLPLNPFEGIRFDDSRRSRMVIAIEKLIRSGAFLSEPFVFHVNESVNVVDEVYGIRFCTFNGTHVKDPYERNWDHDVVANKTGIPEQVVPLSPLHFTYDVRSESVLRPTRETFWGVFFAIGKIMVLVILVLIMFVLVYLNCSRLRLLYDRKRTHYFRPYYIDPQVHVTSMQPYTTSSKRPGYYQGRTRVI